MSVAFRVDASIEMGVGHVMRCLTLALALRLHGVPILFICRGHQGNLVQYIKEKGFEAALLQLEDAESKDGLYSEWIGADKLDDAQQTHAAIAQWLKSNHLQGLSLLVVDHYGLDVAWEAVVKPLCQTLLVIDDLANRVHSCDVLLDVSYGRSSQAYTDKVGADTTLLLGAGYCLLRPEFAVCRDKSLAKRKSPLIKNILINMGGADKENYSYSVIKALSSMDCIERYHITLVLGPSCPWVEMLQSYVGTLAVNVTILVNVNNMAELLMASDLVIGGAGSSAWERCALGVPTIMLVMAENQLFIANELARNEAAIVIENKESIHNLPEIISTLTMTQLKLLSDKSSTITDGRGTDLILNRILKVIK